jgi:hypothetical protein
MGWLASKSIYPYSISRMGHFMDRCKPVDRISHMENWIPFAEGEYIVDQAFVVTPDERAVVIENAVIEIFATAGGRRHLKGSGRIQNILLVELLEDTDDLDLILDLGDEYQYRLRKPELQSGKFFAPDAKSSIQFRPSEPWEQIPSADFAYLMSRIKKIDS